LTERQELERWTPREIHTYHFSPKKSVFLGSVLIKDVPGTLSMAAATVAGLGLNLVESNSSRIDSSGLAEWGFFAESDETHISASDLESKLKRTPNVIDCTVRGAEGSVLVDTLHYPLQVTPGAQAILVRKDVFSSMLKFVVETYGSAGKTLAYQLGKATGESDGKDLVKEMGPERVLENLAELTNLYVAQGWGISDLVDLSFNPLTATIRLRGSFECSGRTSMVPVSNFIRGHLAGLAKAFFNKNVECVETMCVAKGDPYCEITCTETVFSR